MSIPDFSAWCHITTWLLWVRQGCRRDVPVTVQRGFIHRCPHEYWLVSGWGWDVRYLHGTLTMDYLFNYLIRRYGFTEVDWLADCQTCNPESAWDDLPEPPVLLWARELKDSAPV